MLKNVLVVKETPTGIFLLNWCVLGECTSLIYKNKKTRKKTEIQISNNKKGLRLGDFPYIK